MASVPLTIAGVCERDLDLFFLEELHGSPDFSRWFLFQTSGVEDRAAVLVDVHRSVTQSNGESDLEATFALSNGERLRVLVENKIDAGFQTDQALRYTQRAESYVAQGRCDRTCTVLVAPARYFRSGDARHGFDARLTYEQVIDRIDDKELGPRAGYKRALLGAAIEKSTRGYQAEADAPVTEFWRAYWRLARELAPELEMAEPVGKPAGASFIYFRPRALPKAVAICHKLPHGNVDLQFAHWGRRIVDFGVLVDPLLSPGMTTAQAQKSAVVRLNVGVSDASRPFDEQDADVTAGMLAARSLLTWWRVNQAKLTGLVE